MKLIGICGCQGAGKSTLGNLLTKRVFSLADPIRDLMVALFYIPRVWTEETELKNTKFVNGKSIRQWMQIIGSTLRANNPNVFVQILDAKIQPYLNTDEVICIPDLRYNNEKDFINGYNGKIIQLHRPGFVVKSNHESEVDWLSFSPVIAVNNDGTLEQLYEKGQSLLTNGFENSFSEIITNANK